MITANKIMPQGRGLAPVLLKRAATLELDWDVRQKSRFDATDSQGRLLGVFLPRGTAVRGGDVLVAEDGSLIRVIAAPQPMASNNHGDNAPSTSQQDIFATIEKLADLRAKGILSDDEFNTKKAELLSRV